MFAHTDTQVLAPTPANAVRTPGEHVYIAARNGNWVEIAIECEALGIHDSFVVSLPTDRNSHQYRAAVRDALLQGRQTLDRDMATVRADVRLAAAQTEQLLEVLRGAAC